MLTIEELMDIVHDLLPEQRADFIRGICALYCYECGNEASDGKDHSECKRAADPPKYGDFYDKDFLYKVNGEQKMGTKTVVEIEMTPTDKTQNFHKIYLYVDKKTHLVNSGKFLDKSNSRYIYTINSLNGDVNLTDASFIFDKSKHPGVEEVNLTQ